MSRVSFPVRGTFFYPFVNLSSLSRGEGWGEVQLSPSICPSTISICLACGSLGSPGMRMISPAMATIISAPLFSTCLLYTSDAADEL